MTKFSFEGTFEYSDELTQEEAVNLFQGGSDLFTGPPIPLSALARNEAQLSLKFEREAERADEWTGLFSQISELAKLASNGEILCVYEGPSSRGPRHIRVRVIPGAEMVHAD